MTVCHTASGCAPPLAAAPTTSRALRFTNSARSFTVQASRGGSLMLRALQLDECCSCAGSTLPPRVSQPGKGWHRPATFSPCNCLPCDPGGFIDDYRLDEDFRNDLGFLYCCHIRDGVPAELELVPTRIVHTWQVGEQSCSAHDRGVVACRTAVCTCTGGGRACMSRGSGSVVSCRGGDVVEVRQRRLPLHCCPLCMATTSTLPPAELRPAALLVGSAHSPQAGCTLAAQPAQRSVQGVRDSNI